MKRVITGWVPARESLEETINWLLEGHLPTETKHHDKHKKVRIEITVTEVK